MEFLFNGILFLDFIRPVKNAAKVIDVLVAHGNELPGCLEASDA